MVRGLTGFVLRKTLLYHEVQAGDGLAEDLAGQLEDHTSNQMNNGTDLDKALA